MTQGQTVYVQWYGKIVEGTVVENTTPDDPLLGCMVAVSIPIQGTMATALFMPAHVYDTPDAQKHTVCENKQPVYKREEPVCENEQYASEDKQPACSIMRFKEEHWDHEHNHIKVEALDEYYQLWRENIAMRIRKPVNLLEMKMEAPTTPDEAVPQNETTCKPIKSVTQLSLFD